MRESSGETDWLAVERSLLSLLRLLFPPSFHPSIHERRGGRKSELSQQLIVIIVICSGNKNRQRKTKHHLIRVCIVDILNHLKNHIVILLILKYHTLLTVGQIISASV